MTIDTKKIVDVRDRAIEIYTMAMSSNRLLDRIRLNNLLKGLILPYISNGSATIPINEAENFVRTAVNEFANEFLPSFSFFKREQLVKQLICEKKEISFIELENILLDIYFLFSDMVDMDEKILRGTYERLRSYLLMLFLQRFV